MNTIGILLGFSTVVCLGVGLGAGRLFKIAPPLLGAALFTIYICSEPQGLSDSTYSLLVTESILRQRELSVERYLSLPSVEDGEGSSIPVTLPYQLELRDGRILYRYPLGSSIIAIPIMGMLKVSGFSVLDDGLKYSPERERRLQHGIAAALMSLAAVLIYMGGRSLLSPVWSLVIAASTALCTPMWSSLSQQIWSDTWGTLLLCGVVCHLLRSEVGTHRSRPVMLACLLSMAVFAKPTFAVPAALVAGHVATRSRSEFLKVALVGLFWLLAWLAFNEHVYGALLPPIYHQTLRWFDPRHLAEGLGGLLVSPSRGLFIYAPIFLFPLIVTARGWRRLRSRRLAILSWVNIVAFTLLHATWQSWEGGYSYGPRLLSCLAAWFALLAILGVDALGREEGGAESGRRRRVGLLLALLALGWSLFIQWRGALDLRVHMWNLRLSRGHEVIWDWRYPQFLAGLVREPLPSPPVSLPRGRAVRMATVEAEQYLGDGWSWPDIEDRWTAKRRAHFAFLSPPHRSDLAASPESILSALLRTDDGGGLDFNEDERLDSADLVMSVNAGRGLELTMHVYSYDAGGIIPRQRLRIILNRVQLGELVVSPEPTLVVARLPRHLLRDHNVLTLELPDARSPMDLGLSRDFRELGVAVSWICVR